LTIPDDFSIPKTRIVTPTWHRGRRKILIKDPLTANSVECNADEVENLRDSYLFSNEKAVLFKTLARMYGLKLDPTIQDYLNSDLQPSQVRSEFEIKAGVELKRIEIARYGSSKF
jgi:hypothetical protein